MPESDTTNQQPQVNPQSQAETLQFGAEIKQLLKIVAESLYSDAEIFLRELISNSSDACDKLRYEALSDSALYENDSELKIWLDFDEKSHTITVRDNGIGMNREEAIENLGTIAKSGTSAFRQMLGQDKAKDSQLIGQFGVGFYSVFIVADKVVVKTRRAGMLADQGVEWISDGAGEYSIKNINRRSRGTEIVIHLKKDQDEFLDAMRLRNIVRKYSDHILLPIVMKKIETPSLEDKDKPEKEKDEIVIPEDEVVNQANALWTLPKSDIKKEQYNELYKHISHDFEDPLTFSHNRVEGNLEYISLLFIPARAPFELWNRDQQRGLKLYIKRIFIMDDAEQLMPLYLRFVKGIVDSNDLPLNISREILQSNKTIDRIRSGCVKRVLSMLEKMAENDKEQYGKFWKEFGAVLKEGPAEDFANKDRIANLLRFSSTHNDDDSQNVSLKDYVERMPKDQEKIYYLIADTYTGAKNSPLLEMFRNKNIEVLLMHDRVDEWLVSHFQEYDGKTLRSIAQGGIDLGEMEDKEQKEELDKKDKEFTDFLKQFKAALGDTVKEVRLTHRLTDSPACVVFDDNEMSGHMQRLLKSAGQDFMPSQPILELNPLHPLLEKLKLEKDNAKLDRWAKLLFNQALLAEGEQLTDPAGFVKELTAMLVELSVRD